MEHLHLILFLVLMAAAFSQVVAAVLLFEEADRIERGEVNE